MDRRKALAAAGAVSVTAAAAAAAVGANFGLFGLTGGADRVGKLSPVSAEVATEPTAPKQDALRTDVQTIYLDDEAPVVTQSASAAEPHESETAGTRETGDPTRPADPVAGAPDPRPSATSTTTSEPFDDHSSEPEQEHELEPDD